MANSEQLLDKWKKRLLDLGRRNRLINYRETKRSSITIISPETQELFERIVLKEEQLEFPYFEEDFRNFEDTDGSFEEPFSLDGDIRTDRSLSEQQKTLRSLRSRAKTAIEEQGVNILYLSFGFLHWKENDGSDRTLMSPVILVPVSLTLESITSPFKICLHEDEVIINPTLVYKMENDFGLVIPDFDSDEGDVEGYLQSLNKLVSKNGWKATNETSLSLLSFLKINMYKDLENNQNRILSHPIVKAWSGDLSGIKTLPEEFNNFDHDNRVTPKETFHVLDADSSQQDAILYTKLGVSFVLQGPPGTGKSQTITNIISEGLADGKKILFVSEKMAALEVVHNRLTQVELADFCLPLHSHRANKKEVLRELGRSLNLNKIKVREDAIYQLDRLKIERDKLNQYDAELHTPCPPLGKTIYEINGLLADCYFAPDVIFSIDKVGDTTTEQLHEYIYLLNEFSKSINRMSEDYANNPWQGCLIPTLTHELRHDIETKLRHLIFQLRNLAGELDNTESELGLDLKISLDTIIHLIKFLDVAARSPRVPVAWFYQRDMDPLIAKARELNQLKSEYKDLFGELSKKYRPDFFDIPAEELERKFTTSIEVAKKIINASMFSTNESISNSAHSIIANLTFSVAKLDSIVKISRTGTSLLGTKEIEKIQDLRSLEGLTEALLSSPKPTSEWFEPEKFSLVKRILTEARKTYEDIQECTSWILEHYDREIFEIDYHGMLKRFRTEYTSVLKVFSRQYREDKKTLKLLSKQPGKKLSDNEIVATLSILKNISDRKAWIIEKRELLPSLFGHHYQEEFTDWDAFEKAINNFDKILDFFGVSGIPQKTVEILLNHTHLTELKALHQQQNIVWEGDYPDIVCQILNFEDQVIDLVHLDELRCSIENTLNSMEDLESSYDTIRRFSIQEMQYEDYFLFLSKLKRLQDIISLIEDQSDTLKRSFYFLFTGIDTNWEQILNSLSWMDEFKKVDGVSSLPKELITKVCENPEFVSRIEKHAQVTTASLERTEPEATWFFSLFNNSQFFRRIDLCGLILRTESCVNGLSLLEEWIDFSRSRERCNNVGLSDYIEQVQTLKINPPLIVPAFKKRFYRLWLDAMLPNFPAVYSFRSRVHDTVIHDFSELDQLQIRIARSRVRERLLARLPDTNQLTSSIDEVGLLKRELNKQRRIKPLRRLFRQIPNLLLTLKPCLMMSPLSVSLFLESENYHFDIVIFDEASQVCTEDAIGAISRGTQVVIAGDNKQLPPTNFFTASVSDSDYDVDELEDDLDDTDAYDSVLEEAATVLPERTLRWHYRSRHEHLIAFSNETIYRNSLITFPSPIDKAQNVGVEYIRVLDGVYDRGGKRNNIGEANKVADLVWEHAQKSPGRSLGVVTFSEAQQQAVEAAIRQRRLLDQRLEPFFKEDNKEPFFIKNLENVQGDERDTIFISIGYARDVNGVMSLNFGPLNKSGGFRRLNVAITRAKYNVKLIGSIDPMDIDVENTSSEGIKLLQSYIDFAMNGITAIRNKIEVPQVINLESPFEEAVYNFLAGKGYSLATQVGCSGYRIDFAVRHPSLGGRFVLGIECDGASYHSARTARERDRLRQTVLEGNGWKIYRVWSTDWIKDPIIEGQKLCDAIDRAIRLYDDTISDRGIKIHEVKVKGEEVDLPIETPIGQEPAIVGSVENPYNFEYYHEANLSKVRPNPDSVKYLIQIIKQVVKEEYPIHCDILAKRVAPLFGKQRTSSRLKETLAVVINRYMGKDIEARGDFYWLANNHQVRARIPQPKGDPRKIEHICAEEIAEAMYTITSRSIGILKADLFVITARVFGYNRTGALIIQALEAGCDYLIATNRVKEVDQKIIIVDQPK